MSCDYEIGSALIKDRIVGSAVEETRGGRAGQSYQRVIGGRRGGGEKSLQVILWVYLRLNFKIKKKIYINRIRSRNLTVIKFP